MKKLIVIILVAVFIIVILGFGFYFSGVISFGRKAQISEAQTSKFFNKDKNEATETTDTFTPDTEKIFVTVKAQNIKGQSSIKEEIFFKDKKIAESSTNFPGKAYILYTGRQVYFELNKPSDKGWEAGDYKVNLYLGTNLSKTFNFKIKPIESNNKEIKINEVTLCKAVDDNFVPKDKTTNFPSNIEKIYCSIKISQAKKGTMIKVKGYDSDGVALSDGNTFTISEDNSSGYIVFFFTIKGNKWKLGDYQVEIYANDKLMKNASFKISEKGS